MTGDVITLELARRVLRDTLKGADRVVCTSPDYQALSPTLQALGDKVSVIPLALAEDSLSRR